MCPEAKARLQEGFDWWKAHVETHGCLGCSVVRAGLLINRTALGMARRMGIRV